jgi:type IV secretory pathway TraG/TraD family ATPase VirD4
MSNQPTNLTKFELPQSSKSKQHNTTQQSHKPSLEGYFQGFLLSPPGLILLGCIVLLIWMGVKGDKRKAAKLSRGILATPQQIKNGANRTIKQIKKAERANVGLFVGTPKGSVLQCRDGYWRIDPEYDPATLFLSDCNSGICADGGAGSGKSFSFLNPAFLSGLMQGIPGIFYDVKYSTHSEEDPAPTALIAGYARRLGYKIGLFAPGKPESLCCNLLDFLRSPEDVGMARQIAKVLYLNLNPDAVNGGSNPYFIEATTSFLAGVMLLAKQTEYPDLVMCRAITRLPSKELQRIVEAQPTTIKMVFDAVVDVFGVQETYGSLKSTFANLLSGLLIPDVLPSICGKTNIPLDLDGHEVLILGVDAERAEIVNPILATVIHLIANRNLLKPRQRPLMLWLDEISQIYLPGAEDWPNIHRSAGLVMAIGVQFPEMLEKRYGEAGSKRLLKACATKAIFATNDIEDAEKFSKTVGSHDVEYSTKGRSKQKGGNSTSDTEHVQAVPIIEPNEIMQFPQGRAIILNRGIGDKNASRIPVIQQIVIPEHDLEAYRQSTKDWDGIKAKLLKKALPPFRSQDFMLREEALIQTFSSHNQMPRSQRSDEELRQDAIDFRNIGAVFRESAR